MGMTIHFHGKLRSLGSLPELGAMLARHSDVPDGKLHHIDDEIGELGKYLNDDLMECSGPLKGFIVALHRSCEPLFFVFDGEGRMAWSCKTQFAPIDIHKHIVGLLEEAAPHFESLTVQDEGGYWGTHDEVELLTRRVRLDHLINMVAGALEHGQPRAVPPKDHGLN